MMTADQKKALEAMLNNIDKRIDRYWDKLSEADTRGDVETAMEYNYKIDSAEERIDGIIDTLEVFGYQVKNKERKYIVLDHP